MSETTNLSLTANGMVTNSSSLNSCLDFFYEIGSARNFKNGDFSEFINKFEIAFSEDQLVALRILFNARDIRGGKGERGVFLTIIHHLAEKYPEILKKNVSLIPEYGRWKDLLTLFGTHLEDAAIEAIVNGLLDKNKRGLCAKWIPIQGSDALKIRKALKFKTPKEYRKFIVSLRAEAGVVEQKLCSNSWDSINYSHVPSLAIKAYRKAFYRNDEERYKKYLEDLKTGKTKVNASAVHPHEIVAILKDAPETDVLLEAQWKALPNYLENSKERIFPIIDVSGSMTSERNKVMPLLLSISLGLYIAERNKGIFENAFITFDDAPQMISIKGDTLFEKIQNIANAPWGGSTNFERTFDLILDTAIKHSLPEEEMPTMVLVLSDMEFNESSHEDESAFQMVERKYKEAGYEMPKLIFWNLSNDGKNFPITKDQKNAAMISGFSPSIIKDVLNAELESFTPTNLMLEVINSDRYKAIQL